MGIIKRLFCKHKKKIHAGTYLEDIGNGIKEQVTYGSVKNAVRSFINERWYQCMTKP